MRLLLIFSLFFLEVPLADLHEFHVSRARIEYAGDAKEWQISLHIFIDDLEAALAEKGTKDLFLGTAREQATADEYLQAYLQRYFKLYNGDQQLQWEWLGKETSDDLTAFWIYLYVPNARPDQPLKVHNKILLDMYRDQQNMVQVKGAKGNLKNYLFYQDYWEEEVLP
ncbi:DUF6702 family protein [Lewinella sp. LCG006]|uniref:DUF6702 family protein n=1 Tax=Lewinella sp. LCG006 TaxID=3231911 RepID=UPI00345F8EF7